MIALVSRTGRDLQRYNFHGHRQVVGCIPYRYKTSCGSSSSSSSSIVNEEDIEVLVITSQRRGKGMLFPKGGWEKDESIEAAALRETVEEAGVIGEVGLELGNWDFKSGNNETRYEGHMFPFLVKEELEFWPEKSCRERRWITVNEARNVCLYWWMIEALELLVTRLSKGLLILAAWLISFCGDLILLQTDRNPMALEWVVLGYAAAAEAIMLLLLTLPGLDPIRKGLITVTRSLLKPFLSVVPFCLFLLMDIYWKYETRPSCESDSCSPSEHLRHQKSMMKSQRNAILIASALILYWLLYTVTGLVVKIDVLNKRIEKLKSQD